MAVQLGHLLLVRLGIHPLRHQGKELFQDHLLLVHLGMPVHRQLVVMGLFQGHPLPVRLGMPVHRQLVGMELFQVHLLLVVALVVLLVQ